MPMSTNSSLSPTSSSVGEKARFGQSGAGWDGGLDGLSHGQEADDYLHNPDPKRDRIVSLSFPAVPFPPWSSSLLITRRP